METLKHQLLLCPSKTLKLWALTGTTYGVVSTVKPISQTSFTRIENIHGPFVCVPDLLRVLSVLHDKEKHSKRPRSDKITSRTFVSFEFLVGATKSPGSNFA